MRKIIYDSGTIINGNTYIVDVPTKSKRKALFKCRCSKEYIAYIHNIKYNNSCSCGCVGNRRASIRIKKVIKNNITHGDRGRTKTYYLYTTWYGIKQRCGNKNASNYGRYGGRGITMYILWRDNYILFREYILSNLGERPKGYTLDRIDNNGNYEPDNLRWSDSITQAANKRK